jgi:hypothetical protein
MTEGAWHLAVGVPGKSTLWVAPRFQEDLVSQSVAVLLQAEESDPVIAIPPERLKELREAIRRERFFQLRSVYGELVVDGPERRIAVHEGGLAKEITIYTIDPRTKLARSEESQIARVLRVWIAIRNCFDAAGALDSRPEDRSFLQRVKHAA